MVIEISNKWQGRTCVIGKMRVFKDDDIIFTCFTLQEDKAGLERGKDLRIPADEYKLRRHKGSRFEKTLREMTGVASDEMINVYNDSVPYDRYILIHWGNTDVHTQGCILLGNSKAGDNESIGGSRAACKEFYDLMRGVDLDSVRLIVKDEFEG